MNVGETRKLLVVAKRNGKAEESDLGLCGNAKARLHLVGRRRRRRGSDEMRGEIGDQGVDLHLLGALGNGRDPGSLIIYLI